MPSRPSAPQAAHRADPKEANPFDGVDELPGLGIAVLWVVLSYVFVPLLMLPVPPV